MNDLEKHVSQGRQCLQEEKWRDAIRCFQAALRVDLEHAQAHLGLGIAYWHLGRTDEAIFEYRAVLRLHPRSAEAHFGLGVAYRQQGRLEDAIREYMVALRLNPVYAQAHYNLGVAFCQKDRWDEAISEFQAVLSITPDDADAHFGLGLAYKQLGHVDQAIREYQFSLRFNSEFSRAHYNLAVAYLEKGELSMAVREADRARELGYESARTLLAKLGVQVSDEDIEAPASEPPRQAAETEPPLESAPEDEEQLSEHVRGRLRWGLVYLSKGKCAHAAALFEDVVASSPDSVNARVALAKAYIGLRRWEDAANALEPLLARRPDHGEAHLLLGQTLAATDRLDEAVDEVDLALSLGHERADTYLALLREYQAEKASPGKAASEKLAIESVEFVPVSVQSSGPGKQIAEEGRKLSPQPLRDDDEPAGRETVSDRRRQETGEQLSEMVTGGTSDPAARAHYERGQAFAANGRWDDALREFQSALEPDGGFGDAHVAMGKAYVKLKR
ncbi:MAG: tetratricopeptide repeat protein, partial [Anaerolineae bacterium]|nr:tetratricopeptide repeat protein [Anaerolineae bacterium]